MKAASFAELGVILRAYPDETNIPVNPINFAAFCKMVRESHGLSQRAFSTISKTSSRTIAERERGATKNIWNRHLQKLIGLAPPDIKNKPYNKIVEMSGFDPSTTRYTTPHKHEHAYYVTLPRGFRTKNGIQKGDFVLLQVGSDFLIKKVQKRFSISLPTRICDKHMRNNKVPIHPHHKISSPCSPFQPALRGVIDLRGVLSSMDAASGIVFAAHPTKPLKILITCEGLHRTLALNRFVKRDKALLSLGYWKSDGNSRYISFSNKSCSLLKDFMRCVNTFGFKNSDWSVKLIIYKNAKNRVNTKKNWARELRIPLTNFYKDQVLPTNGKESDSYISLKLVQNKAFFLLWTRLYELAFEAALEDKKIAIELLKGILGGDGSVKTRSKRLQCIRIHCSDKEDALKIKQLCDTLFNGVSLTPDSKIYRNVYIGRKENFAILAQEKKPFGANEKRNRTFFNAFSLYRD